MSLNPINKLFKISTKMTILYALMFSVVLVVIDASILFGIKYNFVNQSYSQIENTKQMILKKIPNEDITSSDIISDIPFNENIAVKITVSDGNVVNSTNSFKYKNNLFINLEKNYPNQPFYFYIKKSDSREVSKALEKIGKRVCGTGLVELYNGRVEMQKSSVNQLF